MQLYGCNTAHKSRKLNTCHSNLNSAIFCMQRGLNYNMLLCLLNMKVGMWES